MQGAAGAEAGEAEVDRVGEVDVGEVVEKFFWKVLGAREGGGLVFSVLCLCMEEGRWTDLGGGGYDRSGKLEIKKKKRRKKQIRFLPKNISCGHRVQLSF